MKKYISNANSFLHLPKKEVIKRLIPPVIVFAYNCFCYCVPKAMVPTSRFLYLDSPIDMAIPLIPTFLIFYYGSYVQWLNYFLETAADQNEERKNRYYVADLLTKTVCIITYFVFPLAMIRPEITNPDTFFLKILAMTYKTDNPLGCLPSIHCIYSYLSFRYSYEVQGKRWNWISLGQLIFSILVFASTVLVKQHWLIDMFGAFLVSEFMLWITKKYDLGRYYRSFCEKLFQKLKI